MKTFVDFGVYFGVGMLGQHVEVGGVWQVFKKFLIESHLKSNKWELLIW